MKRLLLIALACVLLLGCARSGQGSPVSQETLFGVWKLEGEEGKFDYLEFRTDGKARYAEQPYGADPHAFLSYAIDADTVRFENGPIQKAVYDAETDRLRITFRDGTVKPAERAEGMHAFWTCTGVNYCTNPVIPYEERKAEAVLFLEENRELLERAAADWTDREHLSVSGGAARTGLNRQTVDPETLPESLRALVGLSEETGIDVSWIDPDSVIWDDPSWYVSVAFPTALDETVYSDPGTLYTVELIYSPSGTKPGYGDALLEQLSENWFVYVNFYAY
jgi:hypothetical protein